MSARQPTGRGDRLRASAVALAALGQLLAGIVGGAGLWGEPVGVVANAYPTLVLPAGTAFSIWSVIYAAFLLLAARQMLPQQLARDVYRRTGWWLVTAGAANVAWIAAFTHRQYIVAQVVILVLLCCLGRVLAELRHHPADGWAGRLLLHSPIALYTGWVTVATVAGAATTGAAGGLTLPRTAAVALAVAALVGTAVAAAWVVWRVRALLPFALAVAWALAWISPNTPSTLIAATAALAAATPLVAAAIRLVRSTPATTTAMAAG